jgi:hypothetical protein
MVLDDEIAQTLQEQPMDELSRLADKHGHYKQLTAKDCLAFEEIYKQYQRNLYVLAIKKLYKIKAVLNCVGNASSSRASTIYNNFVCYNPEASRVWNDGTCCENNIIPSSRCLIFSLHLCGI